MNMKCKLCVNERKRFDEESPTSPPHSEVRQRFILPVVLSLSRCPAMPHNSRWRGENTDDVREGVCIRGLFFHYYAFIRGSFSPRASSQRSYCQVAHSRDRQCSFLQRRVSMRQILAKHNFRCSVDDLRFFPSAYPGVDESEIRM